MSVMSELDQSLERDRTLAELGRQVRDLVAGVSGPLRRIRIRSGDRVFEVEWHQTSTTADGALAATASIDDSGAKPDTAVESADQTAGLNTIDAPMVGTFYRAPEPGGKPFVEVGDQIRPGQVIGIVEAMKLMNQVTADRAGTVVELLAGDGEPVEFGQPLLRLTPPPHQGG